MQEQRHRRAQIDNAIAALFEPLLRSPDDSGYPFQFKTVQKRYVHWTSLEKQGAVPALMLMTGDDGKKPESPVIGFIDERYPINIICVLKEDRGGPSIIDQASDMHYSVEDIFAKSLTAMYPLASESYPEGVEGVIVEGGPGSATKIKGWRTSEEALFPILIVKFHVDVVHRYYSTHSI